MYADLIGNYEKYRIKSRYDNNVSWANVSRVLTQNLQNLGSTIGDISIHAFKPFLIALNNGILKLNEFAKAVANSLGQIFGWTYEESGGVSDVTDDAEDASTALDDAADSAKALKQQLQGFDELNVITTSTSSSGSGDSDTSGVAAASEGTWKKTESMFANYESELDTLQKLGEYVATSISNSLNSIDWDSVYAKASGFGKGLADFMVGLFNPDNEGNTVFASLGTAIAGGINTAISAFSGWQTEFSKGQGWQNLGNGIAQMVANSIEGVKWEQMETLAGNLGSGVAKAINAFTNSDSEPIKKIGKAAAKIVKTGISYWYDYVETLDFPSLGEKIGDGINAALDEMNVKDRKTKLTGWQKLGKTLSDNISGILETLTTALDTVHWEDVGQAIADFIGAIDFGKITWNLGSLVSSLSSAVYTLVSKKSTWSELGDKIGDGINKFLKSMGTKNAKTGLTGWQALGKSLSGFIDGIVTAFVAAVKEIEWDEVGKALGQSLSSFFTNDDGTINISSVNVVLGAIAWKIMTTGFAKAITKDVISGFLQNKFTNFGKIAIKLASIGLTIAGIYQVITASDSGYTDIKQMVEGSIMSAIGAFGTTGNWKIALADLTVSLGIAAFEYDKTHAYSDETISKNLAKQILQSGNVAVDSDEWNKYAQFLTDDEVEEIKTYLQKQAKWGIFSGSAIWESLLKNDDSSVSIDITGNITDTTISDDLQTPEVNSNAKLSTSSVANELTGKNAPSVDATANFTSAKDSLLAEDKKNKFKNITANFDHLYDGLTSTQKSSTFKNFWANFSKLYDGLSADDKKNKFKYFTANFNKIGDSISSDDKKSGIGGITAGLKYISDGISSDDKKISGFTAVFTSTSGLSGSSIATNTVSTRRADGGIFSAGTWKNIPKYAAGTLNAGTVFVAGEAGAEAVAHINGKTEVLNQSQLASAIAAAVVSANTQQNTYLQEQNAYLREQNRLLQQLLDKNVTISDSQIGKSARRYAKDYFNRTGNEAYSF